MYFLSMISIPNMEKGDDKKRIRSANFTASEKYSFINIVSKYKDIIENKKTDQVSSQEKNAVWNKIAEEFNATTLATPRSTEALKNFFKNKKKDVRQQAAAEKLSIKKTGSGPPLLIKKDATDDLLLSIMNKKTIYGLPNAIDSSETVPSTSRNEIVYEFSNDTFDIEVSLI